MEIPVAKLNTGMTSIRGLFNFFDLIICSGIGELSYLIGFTIW